MRQSRVLARTSKVSAPRFPERTFVGRERVSLAPRWVSSWLALIVFTYLMVSYALSFFGVSNPINNLLFGDGSSEEIISPPEVVPDAPINTAVPFYASSLLQSVQVTQTAMAQVPLPVGEVSPVVNNTPTPIPATPTIQPSATARSYVNLGKIWAVGYSYYFPPFGPPNCSEENWKEVYCEDTSASGLPWSKNIGVGVAVPVEWRDEIPLLSVIRVLDNPIMEGEYLVMDYCGDCIKSEGHVYFDFLDNRARLNWTVPLLVQLVSVPK